MATHFGQLKQQAASAVILTFGEPALLTFRIRDVYVAPTPYNDRPAQMTRGVFSARSVELPGQRTGTSTETVTQVIGPTSEFRLATPDVDNLAFLPRPGDLVTLTGRRGRPLYAVSAVHMTDVGDLNLLLVREDPEPRV
jgi:hypothetical protein